MESPTLPMVYAVDLENCDALPANGAQEIAATFRAALCRAGATIVGDAFHQFPGGGLTCVFILSESHAALHTWPETGTVNIDIFSCSPRLGSLAVIEDLRRSFGARRVTIQEIPRADGHHPRSRG